MDTLYDIQSAGPRRLVEAQQPGAITKLPILILSLHSRCNCRCVMCDIWKRSDSQQLQPLELERHRQSLIDLEVRQVVFTGGEPLMNRNFLAIGRFFRELGIRVTLLTTGLLLCAKAAEVAACVDEIIISLDGPADVHNAIRRIPNAFDVIQRGVAALRNARPGIRIRCRTTIQKLNRKHLRHSVQAALELGVDSISFLAADLTSEAFNRDQPWEPSRQREISLTAAELDELELEIEALIDQCSEQLSSGFVVESAAKLRRLAAHFRAHLEGVALRAPQCNAPWVSTVMEVDGTLRPCFFHAPVATTANQSLADALNSEPARAFRQRLDVATNPICQRCVCSLHYRGERDTHAPAS